MWSVVGTMAKFPPPDPPKKGSGATQVPHKDLLSLIVDPKDGEKAFLYNELIGEICKLPVCLDDGGSTPFTIECSEQSWL